LHTHFHILIDLVVQHRQLIGGKPPPGISLRSITQSFQLLISLVVAELWVVDFRQYSTPPMK
jgi:hypothetical protein